MASNTNLDHLHLLVEIDKLIKEKKQLDADKDEYLTQANQAIMDENYDNAIELLQKVKQVHIDLRDTINELDQ
ncbi:unnamed protein product [Rotaria sordida]|nr:unnamed protein product [Rotaria sordida]CAF1328576.1 unnamed protein product [Rotaria sordida]CAF1329222.1 unnamed protein product [Rotaria sordida]CAF1500369.1 unnamed protein product [Rotaria sordida]